MGTDLVSGNTVKEIKVEGNNVYVKCVLGWPAEGIMQAFHENMDKKIKEAYPDAQTNLDLSYEISAHGVQQSVERIKGIKNGLVITCLGFAEYLFIWVKFFFISTDYHHYPQNLHPFCRYNFQFAGHYGFSGL